MDDKRLAEIEKRLNNPNWGDTWGSHSWPVATIKDLLAEVKRLQVERAELIAQNALLSDFLMLAKKEEKA